MGNLRGLAFCGLPRLSGFVAGTAGGNLRVLWFWGFGGLAGFPAEGTPAGNLFAWRGAVNIWHRSSS
jgi:hypothetical protein